MRRFWPFVLICLLLSFSCTEYHENQETGGEDVVGRWPEVSGVGTQVHPYLLFDKGKEDALKSNIAKDIRWTRVHSAILSECENILALADQTYVLDSRKEMHSQCCETVRRVMFLAYAYRMTSDERFLTKCLSEVRTFCCLDSWNPYHFLDVAELSFAAAFAYDWLYDYMDEQMRQTLVSSIRDKALLPSETGNSYELRWMEMENNWCQVCHSSLAIAAMAIYDDEPVIAERIIERSKRKITIPMQAEYPPVGAYPEGIGYWGYGTALNAIFIDVLEHCLSSSEVAAIKSVQGFMDTGQYFSQLITNTLNTFAFSDNSTDLLLPEQVIFWFYGQTKDPTLLYRQAQLVDKFTDPATDYKNGKPYSSKLVTGSYARHLPLMVLWGAGTGNMPVADMNKAVKPSSLFYIAEGQNPICVMRSGWETEDIWLGYKVGNPSCPHGHMDVGSFLFEYGGARFAVDLGSDSYSKVAAAGLGGSMFNMEESSIRWNKLLRYNNFSHNTLTINGQVQKLERKSDFINHASDTGLMYAAADLTPSYEGQVEWLKRAVALVDRRFIVVEDYLKAASSDAHVVWNMTTKASAGYSYDPSSRIITLKGKNGVGEVKTVRMKIVFANHAASPDGITVEMTPVDNYLQPYETTAANHSFIRIRYKVTSGMTQRMKVYILPDGVPVESGIHNLI